MDFLDEVQDIERQAVEQGRAQGVWDAKNGDMRDAGVQSGIIKGYPLGLELGFMQALQQDLSDLVAKVDEEEEEPDEGKTRVAVNEEVLEETIASMKGGEFSGRPKDAIKSIGSRIEKRRELLAKRLAEVPIDNSSEVDFKAELESLRALYRSCNPSAGSFIRKDGSVANEETSQAW